MSGLALSSSTSAWSSTVSSRSSIPIFCLAEMLTNMFCPPHSSGMTAVLGELLAHAVGVGARLIDLVDGDDDGYAGGLGVIDRLDGLRHDAVVGGHDQDDDVGHLGAAGTHSRKGGVARGIDEGDLAVVDHDLRSADGLGDAARLAGSDAGMTDGVEQATSCRGRRDP